MFTCRVVADEFLEFFVRELDAMSGAGVDKADDLLLVFQNDESLRVSVYSR